MLDGWMDGRMDGWMLVGAMVRATYFVFRRSLPSGKIDPLAG